MFIFLDDFLDELYCYYFDELNLDYLLIYSSLYVGLNSLLYKSSRFSSFCYFFLFDLDALRGERDLLLDLPLTLLLDET